MAWTSPCTPLLAGALERAARDTVAAPRRESIGHEGVSGVRPSRSPFSRCCSAQDGALHVRRRPAKKAKSSKRRTSARRSRERQGDREEPGATGVRHRQARADGRAPDVESLGTGTQDDGARRCDGRTRERCGCCVWRATAWPRGSSGADEDSVLRPALHLLPQLRLGAARARLARPRHSPCGRARDG